MPPAHVAVCPDLTLSANNGREQQRLNRGDSPGFYSLTVLGARAKWTLLRLIGERTNERDGRRRQRRLPRRPLVGKTGGGCQITCLPGFSFACTIVGL